MKCFFACIVSLLIGLIFPPVIVGDKVINDNACVYQKNVGIEVVKVGKHVDLTTLTSANKRYLIRYYHDLNHKTWNIPSGCILDFQGGVITNGKIAGDNTEIRAELYKIFDAELMLSGTWNVSKVFPEWFGAKGDGKTDDTDAIESCLRFSCLSHGSTYLNNRTYIVTPNKKVAWNVHDDVKPMEAAFVMKSNMSVKGDNSTIKVKDNYCIPTKRKNFSIFFTNEKIENVSFEGITFDCNGANNRLNTSFDQKAESLFSGLYNGHHISICVSSIYGRTESARLNNLTIDKCSFINTAGVTCIGAASTNTSTTDSEISKNWVISNCLFKNNGLDATDHSSIYAQADDVECINNIFCNDLPFPNGFFTMPGEMSGSLCPYEVHGSNQRFINNKIINYHQAMWVTNAGLYDSVDNTLISDNMFVVQARGIIVRSKKINNISILQNTIEVNGDESVPLSSSREAVAFDSRGEYNCLRVENNYFKGFVNENITSNAVYLSSGCDNVIIKSNLIEQFTFGLYAAIGERPLGHTEFIDNVLQNMYNTKKYNSSGVFFINQRGSAKDIIVNDNIFKGNFDNSAMSNCIYLKGNIDSLDFQGNIIINVKEPINVSRALIRKKHIKEK